MEEHADAPDTTDGPGTAAYTHKAGQDSSTDQTVLAIMAAEGELTVMWRVEGSGGSSRDIWAEIKQVLQEWGRNADSTVAAARQGGRVQQVKGPEPVPPTSAARWRANRRAHKSARTQYNPCPGTAVPATCIPLLVMTVDISMNRANGMILLDEDEEEAWEAQLRIGTGVRSGPTAPKKTDERLSDENDVLNFDDMG